MHLLELAAIVVAGTMADNELAVAVFFHPRVSALDDAPTPAPPKPWRQPWAARCPSGTH